MVKGTLLFVLGATVGIIGCGLADTPLNGLHNWIEANECEAYYAKELNVTKEEFTAAINSVRKP